MKKFNIEDSSSPIKKRVLLFSSGMDSFIINKLEEPDILLFIDNKSQYSTEERDFLEKRTLDNLVIFEDIVNHSKIEMSNKIIPARNMYFLIIASYFGDDIILGATAGDRSTDKDKKFETLMTTTLRHIYSQSHWCEGRAISIDFKYKSYTKEDLVRLYVEKRADEGVGIHQSVRELVEDSFSCYTPINHEQCNRCKPDIRKFLAILGATGIDISDYYNNKPRDYFTKEMIQEWVENLSKDKSRGKESIQTINALRML